MIDLKQTIVREIKDFVSNSKYNVEQAVFAEPLVGFSSGDDVLYDTIKSDIGDFYWTPIDAFRQKYQDRTIDNKHLSVISYILPHSKITKTSQGKEKFYPSEEWVKGRAVGELINDGIKKHLVDYFISMGIRAVAPTQSESFSTINYDKYVYASKWSERHVAHVSGLGTFGLSDGLITKVGKAHRCGSVVVETIIQPTQREYNNPFEYCLHYGGYNCQACIKRCPAKAITREGHNKKKCRNYQKDIIKPYIADKLNKVSTSCGLCQSKVPCENGLPISI